MSNTDFLGRAIEVVKKAIEQDTAGEYEKAYNLYYQSLELFMLALKWEKNENSKKMIRGKAAEYMERAEKLKEHLAEGDKSTKKKPAAVGSNGKVSGSGGKGRWVCIESDSFKMRLKIRRRLNLFQGRRRRWRPRSEEVTGCPCRSHTDGQAGYQMGRRCRS